MSNPEENRQKALALAAMEAGITPQRFSDDMYFPIDRSGKRVAGVKNYNYWMTPNAALAAAAEAMGREPDPILSQQAPTVLIAMDWMERAVTGALAKLDTLGHPHAAACDLAGAWGALKGLLQQQEQARPALTESQREALLIVAEVAGDLAIRAEAVELGAVSRPDPTELLAWAEELQQPARLLETLFDLAPKEPAPAPVSASMPTPDDMHQTIGRAHGLIQTAIGQATDLDINYATEHLWSASVRLTWASNQIDTALAARAKAAEGANKS